MRPFFYRKYKSLETSEHDLKYLFLEITRKCNLSCIHCGSDCSRDSSMKEMTTESWIGVIDYMKRLYDPLFVITGGEPLISESLIPIIKHIKSIGSRWGVVTNGFALTKEKMNLFIENGLTSITLSVDGTEESHKYIRRHPESWKRAESAMKIIGESEVKIKDVVTCVYPKNLNLLNDTAEILIKNGITSWRLFRIFPKGAAVSNPDLLLSYNQSQLLLNWIEQNRETYKKRGLLLSFSCEGYLEFSKDRKVRNEPFFCRAGINIASILSDGTITGCNNNGPDYYQGNIATDDFIDVWNNRFMEFRDKTWMKTGICADCKEWKNCQGGSIHLRDKKRTNPDFCYIKTL